MAAAITLLCRKIFTQNGFQNFAPTNKSITISTDQPMRVQAFADTSDTSIYAVVLTNPGQGLRADYYCAQTAAAITTLINA